MFLFFARWLCAASLALLATSPALAASTAKAALKEVGAASAKWQADAVVTHISTLGAKADGRASTWLYTLYSPKAKKSAIVTARDTKIEIEPDVRTTSVDPIGDFIDSDKALEAACKHGLKATDSIAMGLTLMDKATSQPRMLWSITVMGGDTIRSWSIDSKDASLLYKNEVKMK